MTDARPATHADDLRLVREALRGSVPSRRSFAQRMRCVPKMLTVINARLDRPLRDEDLEDLVQDTLVSIWRRLDSYRGWASLETWSYRFCRFELANRLRSRGRRPIHVPVEGRDPLQEAAWSFLEFEDVYRAMERVGARDADIVRLKHFDQLSFDEIGRHLDISPNTAKSCYYRGIERLRELLRPRRREVG